MVEQGTYHCARAKAAGDAAYGAHYERSRKEFGQGVIQVKSGEQDRCESRRSRRCFLRSTLAFSLLGVAQVVAGKDAASDEACGDTEESSGLRESLHYTEQSPDQSQKCAGCAFFTIGDDKRCGRCQILGGRVSAEGRCDSWTKKPQ
jgi:High potential iron-sulfur protein